MSGDTKICPYCAEEIKVAAILCRYCGMTLSQEIPILSRQPAISKKQFSNNFYKVMEIIDNSRKSLTDEKEDYEKVFDQILDEYNYKANLDQSENLRKIETKWEDLKIQISYRSPFTDRNVIDAIDAIYKTLRQLNLEKGSLAEDKISEQYRLINFFYNLKLSTNSFWVGLEFGEKDKGKDFELIDENMLDLLAEMVESNSRYFEPLLNFFPEDEIILLREKIRNFLFLIALKFCRLGYEAISEISVAEQKIKVEISELPTNLVSNLPVSIIADWDSTGKIQFNLKSRNSLDKATISRLLAISIPLVIYHQFITLSPPYILKFIGFLPFVYRQSQPTFKSIDSSLKSVEIDILLESRSIVPQFRPKFKMFTSSNKMEESVIQFLLNYQISVFSLVDTFLRSAIKTSVLTASNKYLSVPNRFDRDFYYMTLATNTWWKAEIQENDVDNQLEIVTKWFKDRAAR